MSGTDHSLTCQRGFLQKLLEYQRAPLCQLRASARLRRFSSRPRGEEMPVVLQVLLREAPGAWDLRPSVRAMHRASGF